MPETNYDRTHHTPTHAPASEVVVSELTSVINSTTAHEKDSKPLDALSSSSTSDREAGQILPLYPRKSYWQKLRLFPHANNNKSRPNRMLDIFLAPFKGFTYPVIVYAGLMYGANALVWSGVQNATTGTVYTTLYGFSTTGIAAAYSAGVIGAILGGYYCGKMGRILTVKLARQKGRDGISEPEDTLYMFVASMILVPFAMLLYGLGVTYRVHWFALVFSQGALAVSNCLCVAGGIGYAISSYRELSGDMVTTLILIRNTLSFAVNYGYVFFFSFIIHLIFHTSCIRGKKERLCTNIYRVSSPRITPWLNALGYRNTFIMVAVIGFAWNASLFIMVRIGPRLRASSAERYWKDVAKARAKGLGH